MFLDSQKQFVVDMGRHIKGEPLNLEPGYAEAYQTWEGENKEILYKLSAEERTQSFTDHLEKEVRKRAKAYAKESRHGAQKSRELQELAKRGQLIVASTDDGRHFDTFLTPAEAAEMDPLKVRVFSPTLRSITNNLPEVAKEQSLLHVVSKLREQHFLVTSAGFDEDKVRVEAMHPRYNEIEEVEVDPNQPLTEPLDYNFKTAEGEKTVPETQLAEKFGVAEVDSSLQNIPTIEEQIVLDNGKETQKQNAEQDVITVLAGAAALEALNANRSVADRAQEAAGQAKEGMERPLLAADRKLPTVMASKAAMGARVARHKKSNEDSQRRDTERREKAQRDQDEKSRRQREQAQTVTRSQGNGGGTRIAKGAGIASLLAGSTVVGTSLIEILL